MGNIDKIVAKVDLPEPEGWDPPRDQFNLPFTVELKENFHIHWHDVRIEMMPDDFENFVTALNEAYNRWKNDGKPKEAEVMKRYGWWPGEEEYDFYNDRDKKRNSYNDICHHFRKFPRTESGKLYYDSIFQLEKQIAGQYHIHYKNFRIEIGPTPLKNIIKALQNIPL